MCCRWTFIVGQRLAVTISRGWSGLGMVFETGTGLRPGNNRPQDPRACHNPVGISADCTRCNEVTQREAIGVRGPWGLSHGRKTPTSPRPLGLACWLPVSGRLLRGKCFTAGTRGPTRACSQEPGGSGPLGGAGEGGFGGFGTPGFYAWGGRIGWACCLPGAGGWPAPGTWRAGGGAARGCSAAGLGALAPGDPSRGDQV